MSAVRLRPYLYDLYLARVVVGTVLLTWAILLGLDILQAVAGELADLGKGRYHINHALVSVALSVPRRAYTLFPTSAVIGALMGLGQLAATSELTALRALGLSRRRLTASVAIVLALLTALMVANGETLAPWGEQRSQSIKNAARSDNLIVAQYSGLWAREGDMFLNAAAGQERNDGDDRWLELRDVRLYEFAEDGRLQSIARAEIAEHRASGWLLRNVLRTSFGEKSITQVKVAQEHWESQLDETALAASVTKPRYLPAGELRGTINYRKRNQLDASEFEKVYWGRWFYPLNVLALCLAAIPFAFGTLRSGGLGKRLFMGIVFALGFWVLQELSANLAGVYKFDYRIAYALPPVVMLLISGWLFKKRSG
ncbi:MAG: LPS export ABC transporter permease LptG [Luteimonas sp.]